MPFNGITPKAGRILIAAFGLLCLAWSFRYFEPFAPAPRFAEVPRPPQGDVPEYPKMEDLTAAAEAHRPFKSTKSWFFGANGDDAVVIESEEWFRLSAAKSATNIDLSTQVKNYANVAASTSIPSPGANVNTGTDAGSLEEYVAPANTSVLHTALTASEVMPSPTPEVNQSSVYKQSFKPSAASSTTPMPLILYAYSAASWAIPNLQFFLKHGLHGSAIFIFVVNGALVPDNTSNQSPSAFINSTEIDILDVLRILEPYVEKYQNIKIWKRPNTCYDLGAYAEVLKTNSSALAKSHEKFILINASLRGPFVPFWSQECWSDAYLRLIDTGIAINSTGSGPVKLVGMTINCVNVRPRHIQSMILATDRVGINILLGRSDDGRGGTLVGSNDTSSTTYTNIGIDACPNSMDEAVNIEVSLTSLIQSHNFTVRAMMAEYWSKQDYELDCINGDINAAKGAYEGGDLGVFETLFIKTRWAVEADQTERLTQWYDGAVESGMRRGAWDMCGKVKGTFQKAFNEMR
jgi:hypothetical protein